MTHIHLSSNNTASVNTQKNHKPLLAVLVWLSSPWRIALLYLAGITLAEALTTYVDPRSGMLMHGLVLLILFLQASFWVQGRQRGFLLSLALAPLIRLLSLSLPLPNYPLIYWYMVVGAPLLLAGFVAIGAGKISTRMAGLTIRALPFQLLVAVFGFFLGYLEYLILRPAPLIAELRLDQIWLPALILLIFTGFLEEFIFRGLMQYTAIRSFGRAGFFYVAVLFAVLHLGYHSALDILFVFLVAVFFGWAARRSGSIFGVTIAHGLTNISLFLIFPFLIASLPVAPPSVTEQTNPIQGEVTSLPSATPKIEAPNPVAPGLLAPIPTLEATRPWLPPTATPAPSQTATSPITATPTVTAALPMPQNTPAFCVPQSGWVAYIIHPGDTLFSLSLRLGISVSQLGQANCLVTNQIIAGQLLYVPFIPPAPVPATAVIATATKTVPSITAKTSTPFPSVTASNTTQPVSTGTPLISPTPLSTATVSTPVATAPTNTPIPTDTPVPTATDTPPATSTPIPSLTLAPPPPA